MKPNNNSMYVIIDACVARSCGASSSLDVSRVSESQNCRNTLDAIMENGVGAVFSPSVDGEWRKHANPWSVKWRYLMTAKRLTKSVNDREDRSLRGSIQSQLDDEHDVAALMKDVHLLELALRFKNAVISSDRRSGRLAGKMAEVVERLKFLQWVDPNLENEQCLDWLAGKVQDAYFRRVFDK